MDRKEFEERIEQDRLEPDGTLFEEIKNNSYALDESEAHSRELWITVWKDGRITTSLTQRGNDYPPETYNDIVNVFRLPRVSIYDGFDIQAALDDGIPEDEIEEKAIETYKDNFSLSDYFDIAESQNAFEE